ncbi:MAG: tetratricopeptide repeat protein [Ignavibacteriales bacterium]|nr:tetratricopeptide repeat protein [Ignavibacteriales bacterium]
MRFRILSHDAQRTAAALLLPILIPLSAFSQITGSRDYALGGSSVMWYPRASALYRNPAELGRIHQSEFFLTTNRWSNLSSMTGTHFEPYVGTFAAGIARLSSTTQYSVGYSGIFLGQHGVGTAVNINPDANPSVSLAFGVSVHLPDSTSQNSGFHGGLTVANLKPGARPEQLGLSAGAAYWPIRNRLRIQASFLQGDEPLGLLGAEVFPFSWFSLQLGTESFKKIFAGVSVPFQYVQAEFAAGKEGVSLSFNFRIGEPAVEQRARHYDLGVKAYNEQRYSEARRSLLTALQYDEAFFPARSLADQATVSLEEHSAKNLEEGKNLESKGNDVEAEKRYAQILRMDPHHAEAQTLWTAVRSRTQAYVKQLIATGDSLMDKKNYERAQLLYEQALEIDPDNETISPRLEDLAVLLKYSAQASLTRAKSFLERNQLDDAQREFERVLASEPRNARARTGIETIRVRRLDEIVERGKTAFNERNYFEALSIFSEVLQRDEKHLDAKTLYEKTREALQPELDKYFKTGLQFYVKEHYKAAIESWDKALLIQPQHQATLEYYKRAQEKQKAIEKLEKENR